MAKKAKDDLPVLVAEAAKLMEVIKGLNSIRSSSDEVTNAIDGIKLALNRIIIEILKKHLKRVFIRLDPNRSRDWDNLYAVLEVIFEEVTIRIPVPQLRSLEPELAAHIEKVNKMARIWFNNSKTWQNDFIEDPNVKLQWNHHFDDYPEDLQLGDRVYTVGCSDEPLQKWLASKGLFLQRDGHVQGISNFLVFKVIKLPPLVVFAQHVSRMLPPRASYVHVGAYTLVGGKVEEVKSIKADTGRGETLNDIASSYAAEWDAISSYAFWPESSDQWAQEIVKRDVSQELEKTE